MKVGLRNTILVSLFSALMVVGAYIRIPFTIPVTFQPFFCAFAGLLLGSRLGALSQIIYVVLGLAGLPVFAEGSGIAYVTNSTFGFLIGFILGAYVIGRISEVLGSSSLVRNLVSVISGLLAIYILGIAYMFLIVRFYTGKPVGIWAIVAANLPYMAKDLMLYVIVAFSVKAVLPQMKKAGLL